MGSIKPSSGLVAPPQLVPYSFTIFQTPAVGQGPPNDTASFWCSALHLFPLPKSPTQVVCAGDDHRVAVQSDGSAAGSKGSSYSSTEPGIAPMIGMVPLAGGSGDNIATGRPRFVIVTGSRSLPICPITRRHFVLKSVIAIFFTVSPLQRRTGPMSNTRSCCNAGMRKNGCSFERLHQPGRHPAHTGNTARSRENTMPSTRLKLRPVLYGRQLPIPRCRPMRCSFGAPGINPANVPGHRPISRKAQPSSCITLMSPITGSWRQASRNRAMDSCSSSLSRP